MSPKKKKSIFYYCFPCIKFTDEDPDELLFKNFGKEFTEYEYVIENLAIRRAPKILLDQPPSKLKHRFSPKIKHTQTKKPILKDFGAVVEKRGAACDIIGPIVKLKETGDASECCPCETPKSADKVKKDVLKKILIPPCHVARVEHTTPRIQKWEQNDRKYIIIIRSSKVSAEVHKSCDGSMPKNIIPSEIKQTIDALKVAKPPVSTILSRKNRRKLVRSVSDTSCDKETLCNFLDSGSKKHEIKDELGTSLLDVFSMQNKRKTGRKSLTVSKLTEPSIPLGKYVNHMVEQIDVKSHINKNKKTSSQNSRTVSEKTVESDNNENIKWKIVINKHKATKQNIWLVVIFTFLSILFILYKLYRLVNKSMTSSSIHFFVVTKPPDKLTIIARRSQVKVSVSEHIKVHEKLSLSNESTEAPSSASSNPCARGHHNSNPDIISDISSQESCSRKSRKVKWPMHIEKPVPSFERRLTEQMKIKMMHCSNEEIEPKLTFYST